MKNIDTLISIWSMRPAPDSPEGKAWEAGARQGFEWGALLPEEENKRLKDILRKVRPALWEVDLCDLCEEIDKEINEE